MILVPRPHQVEAISLATERNTLLADDCGAGKTLVAIETGKVLCTNPPYWRGIVICTKRLVPQWVADLKAQDPEHDLSIYPMTKEGPPPVQVEMRRVNPGWHVVYYESFVKYAHWYGAVLWDIAVADEAHRIKNRRAKWTIAWKKIQATRKLALTGTAMERSPADLWSLLHWLYPSAFRSYWDFVNRYVDYNENFWGGMDIKGVKDPEALAHLLRPFFLRRTKEEIAPYLPPKTFQYVPVEMEPSQASVYQRIKKAEDAVVNIEEEDVQLLITSKLAEIVRLQQISTLPAMLDIYKPAAKIDWVLGWLEDNPDVPVVIFTKFREAAEEIHYRISQKESCSLLIGGVPLEEVTFLRDDSCRVLVGTIAAMGEGLNLQKALFAIFVDQEWSTVKMNQAYDRIHRINDVRPKHIYMLFCPNTVDELVLEALERKWDQAEMVYEYIKRFS